RTEVSEWLAGPFISEADRGVLAGSAWFCVWRRTEMFSVKQAAEQLGVSAKLVYSLCAGGKIVHERHGLGRGTIRIAEEALEEHRRSARAFYRRLAEMR